MRTCATLATLASEGLRLHGLGFKLKGLASAVQYLASADSLAWSYAARRGERIPGHTHKSCANCFEYAMDWHCDALDAVSRAARAQSLLT